MEIEDTGFDGLKVLRPKIFSDERGIFFEFFNRREFNDLVLDVNFVQDNHAVSFRGVLRGMHFQLPSYAQDKLIRVTNGEAYCVVADLRRKSNTYGKTFSVLLNDANKKQLFIPKGFANGYLSLEDNTVYQYKCSNYYNKESERGIIWNDPTLDIDWGEYWVNMDHLIISPKDRTLPRFKDIKDKIKFD